MMKLLAPCLVAFAAAQELDLNDYVTVTKTDGDDDFTVTGEIMAGRGFDLAREEALYQRMADVGGKNAGGMKRVLSSQGVRDPVGSGSARVPQRRVVVDPGVRLASEGQQHGKGGSEPEPAGRPLRERPGVSIDTNPFPGGTPDSFDAGRRYSSSMMRSHSASMRVRGRSSPPRFYRPPSPPSKPPRKPLGRSKTSPAKVTLAHLPGTVKEEQPKEKPKEKEAFTAPSRMGNTSSTVGRSFAKKWF